MRTTRYAASLAAATIVLAACSSEAGNQAQEEAEETAAVATDVEFPPGTTMAELAEAGSITVGTKYDQPGFGLLDVRTQTPEGFDVEIAKIVAGELGIAEGDIQWTETVSANREPFIQNGQVDIMVAKDNPEGIEGPEDLAGKTVCSVEGSTPAQRIRTDYPEAQLITYDVYSKCADDLRNGNVAAVTTDNVILTGLVEGSDGAFELVGNPFTEEPYGIGLTKGDTEFRDFINDVLEEAYEDGRWEEAWDSTAGAITGQAAPEPPAVDRY